MEYTHVVHVIVVWHPKDQLNSESDDNSEDINSDDGDVVMDSSE